jgi:hypothetical protein
MKNRKKLFGFAWPVGILSLATLALVAGWIFFRWQNVSGQSSAGTPGTPSADQSFIQGLQRSLSSSRLNDADRQALQKKLEYSQRLAAQQAAKPETHGPKGTLVPPVAMPQSAVTNKHPEEHIIPGSEGVIHSWEASINNLWEGSYNGSQYQVFAGASPDDSAQGLVIVFVYPSDQSPPIRSIYQAPLRSGAMSIVERQGGRLRCATLNGSTLYFDLETRTFQ